MGSWTTAIRTWAAGETVTAANMNAQLKDFASAFGALTSYTPTLTGFTPGNGTTAGGYLRVQKMTYFWAKFTFGSTSAGASATPKLSLPITASSNAAGSGSQFANAVRGGFIDASGSHYTAFAYLNSTTTVELAILGSSGVYTTPSTTTPFTWTTSDSLMAAGWYEAA